MTQVPTRAPHLRSKEEIGAELAVTSRWHPDKTERLAELRQDLREAVALDAIQKIIDKAPPLTPERRARLAALLAVPDGGDGL